ncbi:hypothetical protein BMF29_13490 [Comamonas kerstersii]|nr:hypothetical protein BMF29_13490 [Comamonas kerstersii]
MWRVVVKLMTTPEDNWEHSAMAVTPRNKNTNVTSGVLHILAAMHLASGKLAFSIIKLKL